MVMVYLLKERFPSGTYSKLSKKKIGPSRIIKKIGGNAYEVDLPPHAGIHPTFNISDLYPYHAKEDSKEANNIETRGRVLHNQGNLMQLK